MGGNKDNHVLKMVLTAIFAGMGFALSSVVWFPNMAPFQHFINVLAAVFVGPYWGFFGSPHHRYSAYDDRAYGTGSHWGSHRRVPVRFPVSEIWQ